MSCQLTAAIALDCLDSIGGIKTCYVSTDFDYTSITAGATAGITALSGATGQFYEFALPKDTGSITETWNISQTNGSAFWDQALTINIQHLSSAKRQQLQLLSYNRASRVVVEDSNGLYWFIGLTRGCTVTAGTSSTGVAPGDPNQYVLTISAQEPEMMYQVQSLSSLTGCSIVPA
jgi:hypothetical protein